MLFSFALNKFCLRLNAATLVFQPALLNQVPLVGWLVLPAPDLATMLTARCAHVNLLNDSPQTEAKSTSPVFR